tara:strand:+ start:8071 stop:9078 length:1008 start_codon:yes stop_codon:yes gene_type:complete
MSKEELQPKVQPEVELDTDGIKDEAVELPEEKKVESETPDLNKGEVDLGYQTFDSKSEEKPEVEEIQEETSDIEKRHEEPKENNLQEFSDGVQKRIDKLTRRYREAERREKAALDYAKSLQKKYSDSEKKYDSADEQYLKEFDARVDSQREQVKIKLKDAIESNDAEKIMEANDELTRLTVEKEKARIKMADREQRLKTLEEQKSQKPEEQQQIQQPPQASEKARGWAAENTWFGNDRIMTNAAFTIHEDLVGMGIDVESDEYYNEVDKRMRENFPHKFVQSENEIQRKPVQTVASAGRKQQGRRTVRLTKSQVAIAKKLGVPLEEYAKYVKEVQ